MTIYENSKAIIIVDDSVIPYYLQQFKDKHFEAADSRHTFLIDAEEESLEEWGSLSVDSIVDALTRDGSTAIEKSLLGLKGVRLGLNESVTNRELYTLFDDTTRTAVRKYDYGESNLVYDLCHGRVYDGHLMHPGGRSEIGGTIVHSLSAPRQDMPNPFQVFHNLTAFYQYGLKNGIGIQSHEVALKQFYEMKTMAEADAHDFGLSAKWQELKQNLAATGITSFGAIQDRVRQFEYDFFPGEFERAAVGIRQTREWLRSLKD